MITHFNYDGYIFSYFVKQFPETENSFPKTIDRNMKKCYCYLNCRLITRIGGSEL